MSKDYTESAELITQFTNKRRRKEIQQGQRESLRGGGR